MDIGYSNTTDVASDIATTDKDEISSSATLDGVPLSLMATVCALAGLGVVYAVAILIFNVLHSKDKVIKMTSPNVNVIILMGCCAAYTSMILMTLDTGRVGKSTMEKLLQTVTYLWIMGFSLVYGAIFTKCWRLYMIFKNLNCNSKMTRDEHLLLGIVLMLILDLCVLLPWHIIDPIRCHRRTVAEVFQADTLTDEEVQIDVCRSLYLEVWVGVTYAYKLIVLAVGAFFAFQTRHVTLPAIKDARMLYVVICSVIVMAIVGLPVILVDNVGMRLKVAVGSLLVWFTVTEVITLLLLPKVVLWRREKSKPSMGVGETPSRFQFAESMKRTQEAVRKLSSCLCCGWLGDAGDKYAQDVINTELEMLKRTIRQKDAIIRELNDRLYVGVEKFQEYLRSSRKQEDMEYTLRQTHAYRTSSQPVRSPEEYEVDYGHVAPSRVEDRRQMRGQINQSYMEGSYLEPNINEDLQWQSRADSRVSIDTTLSGNDDIGGVYAIAESNNPDLVTPPRQTGEHGMRVHFDDKHHQHQSPSPNCDSAIDNASPSSDSSYQSTPPRTQEPGYIQLETSPRDDRIPGIHHVTRITERQTPEQPDSRWLRPPRDGSTRHVMSLQGTDAAEGHAIQRDYDMMMKRAHSLPYKNFADHHGQRMVSQI